MKKRVLCFGDSNTWGYVAEDKDGGYILRFPFETRWPGALQTALGAEWTVIEDGLCGRTSAFDDPDASGRNGFTALKEALRAEPQPDYLVLALGINDLKENVCGSPETSAAALGSMLDYVREKYADRVTILVLSPAHIGPGIFSPPFELEFGRPEIIDASKELARRQEELAAARGLLYVAAHACASPGRDGLHITAESHRRLAQAVAQKLTEHLSSR